ncbi:AGE family epimerase/isomerase [Treponema sp. OttesenSCG-928-L16]|nr:AGE family epimerase/isomerase [Treponema sp. OttesenSCG-928-L16]
MHKAEPSKDFYRNILTADLLPFWERALDKEHGGVYTCFDNSGKELLSKDKYLWSQGRFLWMWSRFAECVQKGIVPSALVRDIALYEDECRKTAEFIDRHGFMENGNAVFLLSEDGKPKTAYPDSPLDASIYADCFACLGFSEYGRVFGQRQYALKALKIYQNITARIDGGRFETMPYPIPHGCSMFGIPMFAMYTGSELGRSLSSLGMDEAGEVSENAEKYARILEEDFFILPYNLEIKGPSEMGDTLLCRHITPGHTMECLWFYIHFMDSLGRKDFLSLPDTLGRHAFDHGWDAEYGGILRFIDRDGGEPKGRLTDDPYESLICKTWDTKLWWVHSESLYFSALMAKRLGSAYWEEANRSIFDYTFSTFPNPDRQIGEWIQIRSRDGSPRNEVVALPVKDPYHIFRNILLLLEL